MGAADEILELEHQISELQKLIGVTRVGLRKSEEDYATAQERKEAAQVRYRHHAINRNYMRQAADIVDLAEYARTLSLIEEARAELATATLEVSLLDKVRSEQRNMVQAAQGGIEACRIQLADYGQVMEFPRRRNDE